MSYIQPLKGGTGAAKLENFLIHMSILQEADFWMALHCQQRAFQKQIRPTAHHHRADMGDHEFIRFVIQFKASRFELGQGKVGNNFRLVTKRNPDFSSI